MVPAPCLTTAPVPSPSYQRWCQKQPRALHLTALTLVTTLHLLDLCRLAVRLAHPETPFTTALRADRDTRPPGTIQRFIPLRLAPALESGPILANSQPMLFAFESVGGFDSLVPARTVALWRIVQGESPTDVLTTQSQSAFMPAFRVGSTRFDLLPQIGVNTIIALPGIDADPSWNGTRLAPLQIRGSYLGPDGQVIDILGPARTSSIPHVTWALRSMPCNSSLPRLSITSRLSSLRTCG